MFPWVKWLCRFLSRKQIFGTVQTDREILYPGNWYITWYYGMKDIKSIFNMLIIWNVTQTRTESLQSICNESFYLASLSFSHLIYRIFHNNEQMQSFPLLIRMTTKRMLFVMVILIKFRLWWFRQPDTIQLTQICWWAIEWIALLNECYANKIVFDIWKRAISIECRTKSHE